MSVKVGYVSQEGVGGAGAARAAGTAAAPDGDLDEEETSNSKGRSELTDEDGAEDFCHGSDGTSLPQREHLRADACSKDVGYIVGPDPEGKNKGQDEAQYDNPERGRVPVRERRRPRGFRCQGSGGGQVDA